MPGGEPGAGDEPHLGSSPDLSEIAGAGVSRLKPPQRGPAWDGRRMGGM